MPHSRRPHVASPDEVRITRDGNAAIIEYADPEVATTNFTVGKDKLDQMSDEQLLAMWNEHLEARDELMADYEHVAVEIPMGRPQVRYEERSDQWVPRGDVIKCVSLGAEGQEGMNEPFVAIDGRDFTIREFVRMVSTYGGWGMRITFVPDTAIHDEPTIEIREPVPEKER